MDDQKYQKFLIKEYKHWRVYLHKDQGVLGRVYLWCLREEASDFLDMDNEEREEFFEVAGEVKKALTKLFKPDLFNYASLGNETSHLHVHLIPRYSSERKYEGITFKDERWGKMYITSYDYNIPEDVLIKMKDDIREAIEG